MNRSRVLPLLLATVALLGVGGYLAFAPAESAPVAAAAPVQRARAVMAVKAALAPGHILRADDLAPLAWPAGDPPAGAILEGTPEANRLAGSVTRRAFAAGELVVPGTVIAPGERGFLAAIVAPGHRAMAIAVDATSAASGLIWPGDRVDVILTQEIKEDGVPLSERVVSETILTDTRVLSTDQNMNTAAQTPQPNSADKAVDAAAPKPVPVPTTVTLELSPAQAERVTVAATLGKLHLTLRGVETSAEAHVDGVPTWAGGVSPALAAVHPKRSAAPASAAPVAPIAAAPAAPLAPRGVRILRGSQASS